jgi:hypothetical protein
LVDDLICKLYMHMRFNVNRNNVDRTQQNDNFKKS